MNPMPIIMHNTQQDYTNVEICLSRSENLDMLYKINLQQELNEDEKLRLEDCVKQKETEDVIINTAIGCIVGLLIITAVVLFVLWMR